MVAAEARGSVGQGRDGTSGDLGPLSARPGTHLPLSVRTVANLSIGSGAEFAAVNATDGYVSVANRGSGNVSVLSSKSVVDTITGAYLSCPGAGSGPREPVFDPANSSVWLTYYAYPTHVISVLHGPPAGAAPTCGPTGPPSYNVSVVANVNVNDEPVYGLYDKTDGLAYFTENGVVVGVSAVDPVSQTKIADVAPNVCASPGSNSCPCLEPADLTYNWTTGMVYVVCLYNDRVAVLSPPYVPFGSFSVPSLVPSYDLLNTSTGVYQLDFGTDIAYDPADGDVYLADSNASSVSVLSWLPGHPTNVTVGVGKLPYSVAYDPADGDVYVTNVKSDTVSVLNGTKVVGTVHVGHFPLDVAYDAAAGAMVVANLNSSNVSVLVGTSVVASVPVGTSPVFVAYDSVNGDAFVVDQGSDNVTVIHLATATPPTYAVSFTESGLPAGTMWYVNISGGTKLSGTTTTLSTSLGAGSYTYTVASWNKRWASAGGPFTVTTGPVSVPVTFTKQTYTVTFTESGISAKSLAKHGWTVVLNGTTMHTTTTMIAFSEENTTGMPVLVFAKGYDTTSSGTVHIKGTTKVPVTFTKGKVVTLTFHNTSTGKKGLNGKTWCVVVDGYEQCSTKATIVYVDLSPGSYSYSVLPVTGYTITATVKGSPISLSGTLSVLASTTVKLKYV